MREKHLSVASRTCLDCGSNPQPRYCPDWGLNLQPFDVWDDAPTSWSTCPGWIWLIVGLSFPQQEGKGSSIQKSIVKPLLERECRVSVSRATSLQRKNNFPLKASYREVSYRNPNKTHCEDSKRIHPSSLPMFSKLLKPKRWELSA